MNGESCLPSRESAAATNRRSSLQAPATKNGELSLQADSGLAACFQQFVDIDLAGTASSDLPWNNSLCFSTGLPGTVRLDTGVPDRTQLARRDNEGTPTAVGHRTSSLQAHPGSAVATTWNGEWSHPTRMSAPTTAQDAGWGV
ncbi:hypothetical protein N656DRAFT_785466, partial [Canariomyces notabilis]